MRYAAYGSNLHPLRLSDRISSARLINTEFLPDWSLHFHKRSVDGSGKCNIVPGGSGVYVAVFDISDADKIVLDKIEGLGSGYNEISLAVPGIGDCVSYGAEDSYIRDSLIPYDWYKELVLVGARAHGFPANYVQRIEMVAAQPDSDSERSAKGWATVGMISTNY